MTQSTAPPKPKAKPKPLPAKLFRAIFGTPKRSFGVPKSYVNHQWDLCRMGRLPQAGAYELAFDPKTSSYHVTILRTLATRQGTGVVRDREHDRQFGVIRATHGRIMNARDEALRYLASLGAQIPDREYTYPPTTPRRA